MSTKRTSTAIAAACLALLGAGCGSDEQGTPIPADIRQELDSRLVETENRLDARLEGACDDIVTDTEPEVNRILARLPDNVDPDTRQTLEDGFARLFELTSQECDELRGQETDTETTPAPPPPETETETTPTVPETDTEPEENGGGGTSPDKEKDKDNGSGGGDGNTQGGIEIPGAGGGGTVAPGEG